MNIETLFRIVASVSGTGAVKEFTADIKKISTNAEVARRSMKLLGQVAATAFAGITIYKFIGDLKQAANYMDDMGDAADRVGISASAFSTLAYQAKIAEVQVSSLERGLKTMQIQLSTLAQTNADGPLAEIGLSIKDIKDLSAEKQFAEIADGINKVGVAADRTRLRQEFFGKSAAELNDLTKLSKERLAELAAEAKKFGVVIEDSGADKAQQFKESIARLDSAYQGFIIRLAQNGTLEQIGNLFAWLAEKVAGATSAISNFGSNIGLIANARSIMALDDKVTGLQAEKKIAERNYADPSRSGRVQLGIDTEAESKQRALKELDRIQRELAAAQDEYRSLKGDLVAGGVNPAGLGIPTGGSGGSGAPAVTKPEFAQTVEDVNKSVVKTTGNVKELQDAQDKTFGAQAQDALKEYADAASDSGEDIKYVFTNAFKGMEDNLTEFVTTGKLNFKSLAASIIADMARIQIQSNIIKPLMSFGLQGLGDLFGGTFGTRAAVDASIAANPSFFANGGIMTAQGSVPLRKYAAGGIANNPQLALFGEGAMPEAYVPLPDGRRIPVALQGGSGAGGSIVANVNVYMDGNGDVKSNEREGFKLGEAFKAAVTQVIVKEKMPGGILSKQAVG